MVYEIKTMAEFEKYIKDNKNVVVDAYTTWCGPCKMFGPVIEEASSSQSHITFVKVDCEAVSEFSERYDIYSVPTLLIFNEGNLVGRTSGYMPLATLLSELKRVLG